MTDRRKTEMHRERLNYLRIAVLFAMAIVLAFGGIGCGERESDDIPTGPAITVDALVEDGWAAYSDGEYQDAVDYFSQAVNAQANSLEAYMGLGYSFAQVRELGRSRQNLGNVISLSSILTGLEEEYIDALLAEAYAGLAATFLAGLEYEDAAENAGLCLGIHPEFAHRNVSGFDANAVRLIQMEAYFGNGDYDECIHILEDEVFNPGGFLAGSVTVIDTTETIVVTLFEDTWSNGIAKLLLDKGNLIEPLQITGANSQYVEILEAYLVEYDDDGEIEREGRSAVTFYANPAPTFVDSFEIQYLCANDYTEFLIELREAIDAIR